MFYTRNSSAYVYNPSFYKIHEIVDLEIIHTLKEIESIELFVTHIQVDCNFFFYYYLLLLFLHTFIIFF